jgi:hypothetical protein
VSLCRPPDDILVKNTYDLESVLKQFHYVNASQIKKSILIEGSFRMNIKNNVHYFLLSNNHKTKDKMAVQTK